MSFKYHFLISIFVIQVVTSISSSPLPGVIYDNPFCKKLIPEVETRQKDIQDLQRQRVKRSFEDRSSFFSNSFLQNEDTSSFDDSSITKIPYKNENDLKLKKTDSSSDDSPYRKKVVKKLNIRIENVENPKKESADNVKEKNTLPENNENIIDSSVGKNLNGDLNVAENCIEIEIEKPEKISKKKHKKSSTPDLKERFNVENDEKSNSDVVAPPDVLHDAYGDTDDSGVTKSKRNAPRHKNLSIKLVQDSLIDQRKKLKRDPVIKIVVKYPKKNKKRSYKSKQRMNNKRKYTNDEDDDDEDEDDEDFDNENDDIDIRSGKYQKSEDDRRIEECDPIKECISKSENLNEIFLNLNKLMKINSDDNKSHKIKIKLNPGNGKDKNMNVIKSVQVITEDCGKSRKGKENRFSRGVDVNDFGKELDFDDKIEHLPIKLKGIEINNVNNFNSEKINETEMEESMLKLLKMMGINDIFDNLEDDEDDDDDDEDDFEDDDEDADHEAYNSLLKNIAKLDGNDNVTSKRQVDGNSSLKNNTDSDNNLNNLPPEVLSSIINNYYKENSGVLNNLKKDDETSVVDNKNIQEGLQEYGINENRKENVNAVEKLKEESINKKVENSPFDYDIFSSYFDLDLDDKNEPKMKDKNTNKRENSLSIDLNSHLKNSFNEEKKEETKEDYKLPINKFEDIISRKEFEDITKYIYETSGFFNNEEMSIVTKNDIEKELEEVSKKDIESDVDSDKSIPKKENSESDTNTSSFGINGIETAENKTNTDNDFDFDISSIIRDIMKMEEIRNRNKRENDGDISDFLSIEEIMKLKNEPVPFSLTKKSDYFDNNNQNSGNSKYNKVIIQKKPYNPISNNYQSVSLSTNSQYSDNPYEKKFKRSIYY